MPTGPGTQNSRKDVMGLLDGKRLLITGVITDASLAFHSAKIAQEQGAEVVLLARSLAKLEVVRDSLAANQGQQHAVLAQQIEPLLFLSVVRVEPGQPVIGPLAAGRIG